MTTRPAPWVLEKSQNTLGQDLAIVLDKHRIGGAIFEAHIDPDSATIARAVYNSDGWICVARNEQGDIVPVLVWETFDMNLRPS